VSTNGPSGFGQTGTGSKRVGSFGLTAVGNRLMVGAGPAGVAKPFSRCSKRIKRGPRPASPRQYLEGRFNALLTLCGSRRTLLEDGAAGTGRPALWAAGVYFVPPRPVLLRCFSPRLASWPAAPWRRTWVS